jgi:signal transduction histidine kinase
MPAIDTSMFHRLRNRFLALSMVLTSLIIIAAFAVVYVATSASTHAQNQRDLQALADVTISMWVPVSSEDSSSFRLEQAQETTGAIAVHDENGDILTLTRTEAAIVPTSAFAVTVDGSGNIRVIDSLLDLPQEAYKQAVAQAWENPDGTMLDVFGRQWLYAIAPVGDFIAADTADEVTVTVTASGYSRIRFLDVTESQTALRNLLLTLIAVGLVALAAVFAVSLLFANRSIKPIAYAWEQQRRFVADASHELKTPLAIITANSDVLLANQEQTIASQREWLDYLRIGTNRMGSLIDELLTFARIEDADAARPAEPVDLSMVAQTTLQSLRAVMEARRLQVTADIEPDLTRALELGLADKVFFALLENAAEYADEGGRVEVALRSTEGPKGGVLFVVENSGPSIAETDLPHIFERFYRADSTRHGDGHSFGLGLSIAQEAVRRLGGEISVQSNAGEPTRFIVRF